MMWLKFLQDFNGVRLIHESEWLSSDNIELYTDSSGNPELGCGAYCQGHWSLTGHGPLVGKAQSSRKCHFWN